METAEIKVKEMDEETLRQLVTEVLKNPEKHPTEAKLILSLETWTRQGPSYDDFQNYEVIFGEVKEIELGLWDEGYPYRRGRKVALVPLTMPVVVMVERYADTTSPVQHRKIVFVFTKDGWKSVPVY